MWASCHTLPVFPFRLLIFDVLFFAMVFRHGSSTPLSSTFSHDGHPIPLLPSRSLTFPSPTPSIDTPSPPSPSPRARCMTRGTAHTSPFPPQMMRSRYRRIRPRAWSRSLYAGFRYWLAKKIPAADAFGWQGRCAVPRESSGVSRGRPWDRGLDSRDH